MDWVKAPLLKALLRRVSSLEVWDVGATNVFSWKTREHFKANLLAKSRTLAILLNQLFYDVHSKSWNRQQNLTAEPSLPRHELFSLLPSGRRYRSMHTTTATHKSSFSYRALPWPTPKSVQHCPCVQWVKVTIVKFLVSAHTCNIKILICGIYVFFATGHTQYLNT